MARSIARRLGDEADESYRKSTDNRLPQNRTLTSKNAPRRRDEGHLNLNSLELMRFSVSHFLSFGD